MCVAVGPPAIARLHRARPLTRRRPQRARRRRQNELCMMEMIHFIVESLDKHFGNVCELDILFHLDEVRGRVRRAGDRTDCRGG